MKLEIQIIRIDPKKQTIVPMRFIARKNAVRDVMRVLSAKSVGHRELLSIEGVPLMVACALDIDEAMPMWRLRGAEDNAGISILFGRGPGGGMTNCPVNADWVRRRIVYVPGETDDEMAERAATLLQSLAQEFRTALMLSHTRPDGATVTDESQREFLPGLIAHDLAKDVGGEIHLTRFGRMVETVRYADEDGAGA